MNALHSPDFPFNTLTGMLEPLKNPRRDKMRQNETVCARVSSAVRQNETVGVRAPAAISQWPTSDAIRPTAL